MARLIRLYLPRCARHVIERGNNREACFYAETHLLTVHRHSELIPIRAEMVSHMHRIISGQDGRA